MHARSVRVFIIHRTLTRATESLMCVRYHCYECVYTRELGTPTASQHIIFDSEKLTNYYSCAPDGVLTSGHRFLSPTLYQLSVEPHRHPLRSPKVSISIHTIRMFCFNPPKKENTLQSPFIDRAKQGSTATPSPRTVPPPHPSPYPQIRMCTRTHDNNHVRTLKDPVVHVRVRRIMETRKDPACTLIC